MKDNVNKYFVLIISIIAVIILLIILIIYFVSRNNINSNDLADVNGQVLTKADLISYNCALHQKSNSNCTNDYIGQLQNLINYTLEQQYLKKHNDLPTKTQVYKAMFYPGVVPANMEHIKYFSNIYNYYYRDLVIKNIENLLIDNATGNIFFISNDNISSTKFVLNPAVEQSILYEFRNNLLSGKYTVQSLISSESSIKVPYKYFFSIVSYHKLNMNNYKIQLGIWGNQITEHIISFSPNKVSPVYTYVYTVKNKVISTFYYFFENSNKIGNYSNISSVLNYLKSSASITLY